MTSHCPLIFAKKWNSLQSNQTTARQTKADNIAGKMTMASLDAEMLATESPPSIDSKLYVLSTRWRPGKVSRG
jgi:hypothetical protein